MPENKRALVVGVDDYPTAPLGVCVHDATELSALLKMPEYGYEVTTLLDSAVTRRNLKSHIEGLLRPAADSYLLYFSGHGWATDVGVYLVTHDADDVEHGVDLEWLRRLVTNLTSVKSRVAIILDCCHAGAGSPRALGSSGVCMRRDDISTAIPSFPMGRVVLAACRGDQVAYEDTSVGHGVFTKCLLDGMMGEGADPMGVVTVTSLYDYVSDQVSRAGMQTPAFRGDFAGRFILGQGFPPRAQRVVSEERAVEIEREGQRHLQDYQEKFARSFGDLSRWKTEGHKTACQMLDPIVDWYARKLKENASLQHRKTFGDQYAIVLQRVATLCAIEPDVVTSEGIVRSRLGSGQFGTVWRVESLRNGPSLAMKVYHPQDITDEEKSRRFRRGYEAMKQLDHPQIVRVHKFTRCPLAFYMDLIEGPNLRNFVGTLDDPRALVSMLLTIGETLKHAHQRQVVHRDVKPENILMSLDEKSQQWRPFLTDFDLAWYSTATQVTRIGQEGMGTWQYSAPEQLANPRSASAHAPTTDSYAFGQLMFFAMTGSDPVPLDVANNEKALRGRLHIGWVEDAANAFVDLYSTCTRKEPPKRSGFDDICGALFRISQLLADVDDATAFTEEKFISELVFSLAGLPSDAGASAGSFVSLLGKTRVALSIRRRRGKDAELLYTFESQVPPLVHCAAGYKDVRRKLMDNVGATLANDGGTHIRPGDVLPFQVYVTQDAVPLTLAGMTAARSLISRVLKVIETG